MKPILAAVAGGALLYLSPGLNDMWFLTGFALVPILWLAYTNVPVWQLIAATVSAWLAGQICGFAVCATARGGSLDGDHEAQGSGGVDTQVFSRAFECGAIRKRFE